MIIAYMPDLMMRSKLDNACRHYNVALQTVSSVDDLLASAPTAKVILIDLDATPELALQLITEARAHSQARVLAFCSHVLTDLIQQGQKAGAHRIYSNSTLTSAIPGLVAELAL
jgi:hypothetical protein